MLSPMLKPLLGKSYKVDLPGIIEVLPGNVYWKVRDKAGAFIFAGCNENVAKVTGLDNSAEIVGKTDFDLFEPDMAQKLRIADEQVYRTGQELTLEEFGINPEGEPAIYLTTKKPLFSKAGEIIGVIGLSQDITQRKRYELELAEAKQKAEEANQAKTVVLSSISHDMLTPLTTLDGATSLIEVRAESTPEIRLCIEMMYKAIKMQRDMIHRVLDNARIQTGGIIIQKEDICLQTIIKDALDQVEFEKLLSNKPIAINHQYEANEYFYTDKDCMTHIFLNLIGNAAKFTEQGEINIIVKGDEERLKIIVQDTGIGIPEEARDRIFDPFERVLRSDRSKHKGYGFGLHAVKKYVEALGGEILLSSTVGEGSTFEVNIRA